MSNLSFSLFSYFDNRLYLSHFSRVQTIEWDMLDKRRFYPYSMVSSFTVRCFLYPLTLVRTRLQVGNINLGEYSSGFFILIEHINMSFQREGGGSKMGFLGVFHPFLAKNYFSFLKKSFISTNSANKTLEKYLIFPTNILPCIL